MFLCEIGTARQRRRLARALLHEQQEVQRGTPTMKVLIAGAAVAALSFAATYALAPYVGIGEQLAIQQVSVAPTTTPVAATTTPDCRAPLGKVIAALAGERCS
jgi:hypothetical protein